MPEHCPQPPGKHGLPRKWKRAAILALLLLAGGAVVNVAVAWGIAVAVNPVVDAEWSTARRYEVGVSGWSVNRYAKRGVERLGSRYDERSDILAYWSPDENVEEFLPKWGNLGGFKDRFEFRQVIGYGWPMIALWAQLAHRTMDVDQNVQGGIHWHQDDWIGVDTGEWAWQRNTIRVPAVLPLTPAWPGFIINTLFYALLLWLLFFAPFAARRMLRRRHGQCEKCGYPIGVSPVCTECGAAVSRKVEA